MYGRYSIHIVRVPINTTVCLYTYLIFRFLLLLLLYIEVTAFIRYTASGAAVQ